MRSAGFLPSPVRTDFGPSRLRSLTWIRCWNLPFLLLPVPRLVGSAASRCRSRRSTASHRLRPDRPSLRCTVEPASQDCSTRVVSVVAFDARNLLVQEDRIDCGALGRSMLSGSIVDLERARRDLARLIRRCERRRAMAISRLRGKAIPSSAASTASTVPPRICGPDVSAACCRAGAAGWAFDASAPAPVMVPSRCARSTRAWLRPPWSRRRPRGVGSGEDAASDAHPLCALPVPAVGVCRRRRRPRWPADGAIRSSRLAACDCQMHQLMQLPRVAAAASHHQRSTRRCSCPSHAPAHWRVESCALMHRTSSASSLFVDGLPQRRPSDCFPVLRCVQGRASRGAAGPGGDRACYLEGAPRHRGSGPAAAQAGKVAPGPVTCCCEAGPCGHALQRRLTHGRVGCEVIAPALAPRKPGERHAVELGSPPGPI